MALFTPRFVIPDTRSGLGLGVIDAAQGMTVSWNISGSSAMTGFLIDIFRNNSTSDLVYTTGFETQGCPAYGVTSSGEPQRFSFTISAAALAGAGIVNGEEYKLVIQQWWSSTESVTQRSASVFSTRAAPVLSIDTIGQSGAISARRYTFEGNYSQAQGDTLNWFRWQVAEAGNTNSPFFDSGAVSGTEDVSCTCDGFFTGTDYAVKLSIQTSSGVSADTGWIDFSCQYSTVESPGNVTAGCVSGADAARIIWQGFNYAPGTANGSYSFDGDALSIPAGTEIIWNRLNGGDMTIASPWVAIADFEWAADLPFSTNTTLLSVSSTTSNTEARTSVSQTSSQFRVNYNTGSGGGISMISKGQGYNITGVTVVTAPGTVFFRMKAEYSRPQPHIGYLTASVVLQGQDDFPLRFVSTGASGATDGITCNYIQVLSGDGTSYEEICNNLAAGSFTPDPADGNNTVFPDFAGGTIDSGSASINFSNLTGFELYRHKYGANTLDYVCTTSGSENKVYDFGALSQKGPYDYYLFPISSSAYYSAVISNLVSPCWWNWSLIEAQKTDRNGVYTALAAYRFRLNIESGRTANNNTPGVLANFTRYPTIQLSPQNYRSSTLTGLIGAVDYSSGAPEYRDTNELRDAIYALSVTDNDLFLKNRRGDLIKIKVSAPITMDTDDAAREQTQTMGLPWTEVGSAENVSIYSADYVGADGGGTAIPSYVVDTSGATADENDIVYPETAYARGQLLTGTITDGDEVAF